MSSAATASNLGEKLHPRYVRWTLILIVVFCTALLGILWWLDPISVTGRSTKFSIVENGGVRQAKLDLMDELLKTPKVLILGSSRSMQLDPSDVKKISELSAFNGAVSGGTTKDSYLYARYAEKLWPNQFPHLIIGLVNDSLRNAGTAGLDPRLKAFLPKTQRKLKPFEVADELLQMKTAEAGVRSARYVIPRYGLDALLHPIKRTDHSDAGLASVGKQKNNRRDLLDARGMTRPEKNPADGPLSERIEEQMKSYLEATFAPDDRFTGVDELALKYLTQTISLANKHGDTPVLWITPFHPDAHAMLPTEYSKRDARFRAAIAKLKANNSLQFTFVDLDNLGTFGGSKKDFHDGIHMTKANTYRVLRYLDKQGVLRPKLQRQKKP